MLISIKNTVSSYLIIFSLSLLTACSGSSVKDGDRFEGTGSFTIAQNGDIQGKGDGKSHSDQYGDHDDDKDNDRDESAMMKYKLNNSTDKVVCTSDAGVVTVYGIGDTANRTTKSTCVITPANKVPTTTASSGSSSSSGTTTTSSGGSTTGTGTTTTGSGAATTGSGTTAAATPAQLTAAKMKNSF